MHIKTLAVTTCCIHLP